MKKNVTILGLIFYLLFLSPFSQAQKYSVDGFVINTQTGEKVADVNILDKNTGIGTISDGDGNFKLLLNSGEINLLFTEGEFKSVSREFTLRADTIIDVQLELIKLPKKARELAVLDSAIDVVAKNNRLFKKRK